LTLTADFPAPAASGQFWYRWRLLNSPCASDWQPLNISAAIPAPPGRVQPVDGALLNDRAVTLIWLPASVPDGAPSVSGYEVQVMSMADGVLFDETVGDISAVFTADRDYPSGRLAWRVRARNDAGWSLWTPSFYFGIDTRSPTAELTLNGVPGANGWWRSPLTARVGGMDAGTAFFQPGDMPWQQVIPGGTNVLDREGIFTLRAYIRDAAFNRSPVITRRVALDWTPPTDVVPVFSAPLPASGFFTAPVTLTLRADDTVSGVLTRTLRADGGAWQTDRLYLFAEGSHPVDYFAADTAGNASATEQTVIRLDRTPPAGTLTADGNLCWNCPPVTVSVTVSDTVSGIARWTLRVGNRLLTAGNAPEGETVLSGADFPPGVLTLTLTVADRAGWTALRTLTLPNPAAPVAPTPTPWQRPTATPLPPRTATAAVPYVTATPTPTATPRPPRLVPTATSTLPPSIVVGNYPVATGTTVPVILPVTGTQLPMSNEQLTKQQFTRWHTIFRLITIFNASLFIFH